MNEERIKAKEKISFILNLIVGSIVAITIALSLERMIEQSKKLKVFNALNIPTVIGIFIILMTMYLYPMNKKE